MNFLFLITARGGSKGIPGKNIKPLANKPLLHYSIDFARNFSSDNQICLSTNDEQIIKVAAQYGLQVPFIRPENLATDIASTTDVIIHALDFYKSKGEIFDAVILLQPTSPFRKKEHLEEALLHFNKKTDMVISVFETHANPYYLLFEEDSNGFLSQSKNAGEFTRRQDIPKVYQANGSLYIINVDSIYMYKSLSLMPKKLKYVMAPEYSIDIDSMLDWNIAEMMIEKKMIEV